MKFLYDALGDIGSALAKRRIWFALASEDISDQYRRTSLGPFWLLINYLVFVATFVFVTPAAIMIFAFLGAYFPDSQFIVQNLTRVGMFLTPVFWAHTSVGELSVRGIFYYWNPFTYFLEIVRVPILSGDAPLRSFALCIAISCAAWLLALFLLGRLRRQVVFML